MSLRTIPIEEPAAHSASEEQLHILYLLIILSRRRKFILCFTLVATTLAIVIVLVLPNKYTAETIVLPPDQSSSIGSALLGQIGSSSALASIAGGSLGIKNPGDMYVSLFRTEPVEGALVRRFGLMARYRKKRMSEARIVFENLSTVALGTRDGMIRITVTDHDPNMAATIANAYVEEVRKLSATLAITEASQRRAFFQQQLLQANESLAAAEEAMKSTQQSTGVLQIDSQAKALIESAASLRGQIVEKEVELQAMRSYATEGNPQFVVAQRQLEALKAQLARLGGKETDSGSDIIVPKGNIPDAEMEYVRRERDLRYYETIDEILAKQFELAKLDEAREGAVIQVAEVAIPPDKRSFPKPTLTAVLALVLSFLFACTWCVLLHGINRMKSNPEEGPRLEALSALYEKWR